MTTTFIFLVSRRRQYQDINRKLDALWDDSEAKRRSTSSVLRACSRRCAAMLKSELDFGILNYAYVSLLL